MFYSIVSLLELALLITGGILLFHRWGYSIAESLSIAIVVTLMTLSLTFQSSFLLGIPWLSFIVEAALVAGVFVMISRECHRLANIFKSLFLFMRYNRVTSGVVVVCIVYLGFQSLLLPEGNGDCMVYNLTRVLLFQEERSLLLTNCSHPAQALYSVGGDILSHLFLRYYTDYGPATIRLLAYLSIGFGGYALARRYSSSNVAWTVMLIVISFPLLVRQATGTKPDILATTAVVLCFLSGKRMLLRPNFMDGLLVILGLGFGLSIKITFAAFLVPFSIIFACILLKQHGPGSVLQFLKRRWLLLIVIVPAILVFSKCWHFTHNHFLWESLAGPVENVTSYKNQDGLLGAVANLLRYGVQSLHLMTPTDFVSDLLSGEKISDLLERAYRHLLYPIIGDYGIYCTFKLNSWNWSWGDGENNAWFGPFGFLLVLPVLVYTLVRGSTYLRMVSIVLVVYVALLCWQIAWWPWNARYLGPVFVGSAGCLGYWLEQRQKLWRPRILQTVALLILVYCCVVNTDKPLVGIPYFVQSIKQFTLVPGLISQGIWGQTNWGRDRLFYSRRFYGNNRVKEFMDIVKPNAKVAILSNSNKTTWLFHYMLYRPDVRFVPLPGEEMTGKKLDADSLEGFDYLLCINRSYEEFFLPGKHELLQEYKPEKEELETPLGEYIRPGSLIRL